MREHKKTQELPGPLSGPWTPAVRDFGLLARDVCTPVHAHNIFRPL